MHNRLLDDASILARADLRPAFQANDLTVDARLATAVRVGAQGGIFRNRQALESLYLAVRDRVRELHADGQRAEQTLMVVKREVLGTIAKIGADPAHAAEIVQLVVRWSVSAYYASN